MATEVFLLDKSCQCNLSSSQLSGDISDDATSLFLVISALLRVDEARMLEGVTQHYPTGDAY